MPAHARTASRPLVTTRRAAVLTAAVLGLGVGLVAVPAWAAPTTTAQPTALTVGTAGPSCKAPTQPTVIAAVAAAAPGAVITVCPGVYTGTVVIDKPLTLRGAQRGVDARAGRTDISRESVIDGGGSAGIQIIGSTSGVTVDGFTIRNSGTPTQPRDGIEAFSGGSGFTFVNDVVTQTTYGINMSSLGAAPSTVARNRFVDNNRSGDQGGSGVFVCCGPGNGLSITDNLFTGHSSAAVNTAGDASRPSTGLRIERNQSIDDATFAVVVNANGASVADNVVLRTPKATLAAGSAFYVGGGTTGVQIVRNSVVGGAATGIRVTNLFGTPNVGLVVTGNRIVNRLNGIRLSTQTSGSIRTNDIATSTEVGILLDVDNAGVTVTGNRIAASKVTDCRDDSHGTRTAGTANTWTSNQALRSTPAGLCGR